MSFTDAKTPSEFLDMWLNGDYFRDEKKRQIFETYYYGYKNHFPERIKRYYNRQLFEVCSLIKNIDRPRVLEIGSGTGTESLWMNLQGAQVDAIELRQDRLEVAEYRRKILEAELKKEISCNFIRGSFFDLPDTPTYDIIWMEQAFHHLEPRDEIVKGVVSRLNKGGYVVISEANALNPLIQLLLIKRRGFKTLKFFEDENGKRHLYGNERIVTASKLSRLFGDAGLTQKSLEYFRLLPEAKIFDRLAFMEERWPKSLLPFFTHYNYVGHKND